MTQEQEIRAAALDAAATTIAGIAISIASKAVNQETIERLTLETAVRYEAYIKGEVGKSDKAKVVWA